MNVNMIRGLANQHKALKAFHGRCTQTGATLTVFAPHPDGSEELGSPATSLIMNEVRLALLKRIKESEEAIQREAHG